LAKLFLLELFFYSAERLGWRFGEAILNRHFPAGDFGRL
jgi:hypothetical protein